MEFLRNYKHRSAISEVIYVSLNVGLAIGLMLIVKVTSLIWPAFVLLALSFWRIFAVRPQFWFANIQANLVSFITGTSYVIFLYVVQSLGFGEAESWILMAVLAAFYTVWLLVLKPLSKRKYIILQAGVALFAGVTALYMVSHAWIIATPTVVLMWLIGYASAKHVLSSYENEDRVVLVSLAWALVMAELGWIAYHWTLAYRLPFVPSILIPQVSIIVVSLSFLAYKIYDSFYHNEKVRTNDVLLPIIFVVAIILVLVIGFNGIPNITT